MAPTYSMRLSIKAQCSDLPSKKFSLHKPSSVTNLFRWRLRVVVLMPPPHLESYFLSCAHDAVRIRYTCGLKGKHPY
ncbi:hypothetical protein GDO81_003189 [Engystomops pustulosus]|uniref:Uncharacterized protein n=1 Tax=Engystomops pustulosus TaxID=76066 RepID=A0AAV6ZVC1_ENGPU|nr:hypothetical protein GDO81_003189 [Engystomops pustulosus]